LADYYKAFSKVYLFVHEKEDAKYRSVVDEKVGLILFSDSGKVLLSREAEKETSHLDSATMMKSLRKAEYLALVECLVGFKPDVPPVHLYKTCLTILADIPVEEVQYHYRSIIKGRISEETNRVVGEYDVPDYLK